MMLNQVDGATRLIMIFAGTSNKIYIPSVWLTRECQSCHYTYIWNEEYQQGNVVLVSSHVEVMDHSLNLSIA